MRGYLFKMAYSFETAVAKGNPRALARASGAKMYMPDKDCPKGHRSLRYTKYGQCLDCLKIAKVKYRNSEKGKQTEAEYTAKYQKKHRAKYTARVYGLSEGDVIWAKWSQNFLCKICETPLGQNSKKNHIDHCHKTKIVRGLLCQRCNQGIGLLNHNFDLLQKAALYCK